RTSSGTQTDKEIPSANPDQTITIQRGPPALFTSGTRIPITAYDDNGPQNGLYERKVAPTSVTADGKSLTVLVPDDAVTGRVRLSDEPGGLDLQIVPVIDDIDDYSSFYDSTAGMTIIGRGFVEGAQTILLGT